MQESLPTSTAESGSAPTQDDTNMRVYYMVHPSIDVDEPSSMA